MLGGILTSFLMELVVYPPIFAIWKWHWEVKPAMMVASQPAATEINSTLAS